MPDRQNSVYQQLKVSNFEKSLYIFFFFSLKSTVSDKIVFFNEQYESPATNILMKLMNLQ